VWVYGDSWIPRASRKLRRCSLVFVGGRVLRGVFLGAMIMSCGVLLSSSVGVGGLFGVGDWSCDASGICSVGWGWGCALVHYL